MSLNSDPRSRSPDQGAAAGTQAAHQHTLLLVDDEKILRQIIASILRKEGYLVMEAATSDAAIDAVRRFGQKLDLLISDMMIPSVGGLHLLEELRKGRPELKAVFISGCTRDEICKDAPLPEGTAFIEKPFEGDALVSTVRQVLG